MALGLVVNLAVARHLGPGDFGLLSYALGFTAIFASLGGLGIDDVLARELVRGRAASAALLAAGLRVKFFGALGAYAGLLIAAWCWRPGETGAWAVVALAGASLWFLPVDAVDVWFQSRERMRPPVVARQIALLLSALLRLALVWADAPLWVFAVVVTIEALFIAVALAWVLRAESAWPDWRGMGGISAGFLLREGGPLLGSGLLVSITMQVDRLLLVRLSGEAEAGVYAVAARFTEAMYALPVAVGAVLLPRLTAQRQTDAGAYWATARRATLVLLGAAVLLAGALAVGGRLLPWLLGAKYTAAAEVLAVHAWTLVFVSLVSLRSRLLVIEGKSLWILFMSAGTVVFTVAANFWLIPLLGAVGAAWASVAGWGCSALVLPWLLPGVRGFSLQWSGLAKDRQI